MYKNYLNNIIILRLPLKAFKDSLIYKEKYLHIAAVTYAEQQDLYYYDIVDNCIFCEEICYIFIPIINQKNNENKNKKDNSETLYRTNKTS